MKYYVFDRHTSESFGPFRTYGAARDEADRLKKRHCSYMRFRVLEVKS